MTPDPVTGSAARPSRGRWRLVWMSQRELRDRLASAYRAGWADRGDETPFSRGYWIDQESPVVRGGLDG